MAARAIVTTKDYLKNIPLPVFAKSYTVISHGMVIDTTLDLLEKQGLVVDRELYKANQDGLVAQGVYYIKDASDPEMEMMFAWSNSYDKSMRFKAAIGASVLVSRNSIISGDHSHWGRKHTGTALQEAIDTIKHQITNGAVYYKQLLDDKRVMTNMIVPVRYQAELLGRIMFEEEILTMEQLGIVRKEIKKPSFDYNCDKESLWLFYNNIIVALRKAHPRHWMDQQREVHQFLCKEFNIGNHISIPVVITETADHRIVGIPQEGMLSLDNPIDPAQISLLDSIAEVEQEKAAEGIASEREVTLLFSDPDTNNINSAVAEVVLEDKFGEKPFPLNLDDINPDATLVFESIVGEPIVEEEKIEDIFKETVPAFPEDNLLTPEQLKTIEENIARAKAELKAKEPVDPDAGKSFEL